MSNFFNDLTKIEESVFSSITDPRTGEELQPLKMDWLDCDTTAVFDTHEIQEDKPAGLDELQPLFARANDKSKHKQMTEDETSVLHTYVTAIPDFTYELD